MIVGVDVGRYKVKVWHAAGHFEFYSNLGESRDLEFSDSKGSDDMYGSYEGRKFTAGTLAIREAEYGDSMMTESKLHEDTVILNLIALHKAVSGTGRVKMVTNLPIDCHERDKAALRSMLLGVKKLTLNGDIKVFLIDDCRVAPEGIGFYKHAKQGKTIRGLNIGSRTVNAITFKDEEKIGRESDTFDFGTESGKSRDRVAMARAIAAKTGGDLKWKRDDELLLAGGGAAEVIEHLKQYYPLAKVVDNPVFLDAEALYNTAVEIYGR
jgi:plasmid segregation protein ParM